MKVPPKGGIFISSFDIFFDFEQSKRMLTKEDLEKIINWLEEIKTHHQQQHDFYVQAQQSRPNLQPRVAEMDAMRKLVYEHAQINPHKIRLGETFSDSQIYWQTVNARIRDLREAVNGEQLITNELTWKIEEQAREISSLNRTIEFVKNQLKELTNASIV